MFRCVWNRFDICITTNGIILSIFIISVCIKKSVYIFYWLCGQRIPSVMVSFPELPQLHYHIYLLHL
jgi:hypothetical protein